jgi:hypothetical protein
MSKKKRVKNKNKKNKNKNKNKKKNKRSLKRYKKSKKSVDYSFLDQFFLDSDDEDYFIRNEIIQQQQQQQLQQLQQEQEQEQEQEQRERLEQQEREQEEKEQEEREIKQRSKLIENARIRAVEELKREQELNEFDNNMWDRIKSVLPEEKYLGLRETAEYQDYVKLIYKSDKTMDVFFDDFIKENKDKEVHWPMLVGYEVEGDIRKRLQIKRANYVGPGTLLIPKLVRGVKPRNTADRAAVHHDANYAIIQSEYEKNVERLDLSDINWDKKEQQLYQKAGENIRLSDQAFLDTIEMFVNDNPMHSLNPNIMIPFYVMQSKMKSEDLGLISKHRFVFKRVKHNDLLNKVISQVTDVGKKLEDLSLKN